MILLKNKILLCLVIFLSPVAVISFYKKTNFNLQENKEKEKNTINVKLSNGTISQMDLEEYVIGVVAAEMPASFEKEALKAQAVASRTYAIYKKNMNNEYDVTTTTSDQAYINISEMKNKWKSSYSQYFEKIKAAVSETKGLVIKYNNEVISAYYFAISNGYTEDAASVFNESKDYLISVESSKEHLLAKNFYQTIEIPKEQFCTKLNISCNNLVINNISTTKSGRVDTITINSQLFKGTELRKILNLRSTDFTILINNNFIEITTCGYGHGVGMSQYGANAMAKEGASYAQIIKHYYQNVTINNI